MNELLTPFATRPLDNSFAPDEYQDARAFYDREGFVVIRGLITRNACAAVRDALAQEVRPSRVPILRQQNMKYERNRFGEHGLLENPIFNVQDLDDRSHGAFRRAALQALTGEAVARWTACLLAAPATKLIQSMFFEAPAGTWAHQDSYYQDSATGLGQCVAGWFALEDIEEDAGRFYVCPRSHKALAVIRNEGALDFALGHDVYKTVVQEAIAAHGWQLHAPALKQGDVLFWNSLTVHGSFAGGGRGASRTSLTAHYLADEDEMLQFHTRIRRQKMVTYNGMRVGLLHDQSRLRNRLVRDAAFRFPRAYALARRAALTALLRLPRGKASAVVRDAG